MNNGPKEQNAQFKWLGSFNKNYKWKRDWDVLNYDVSMSIKTGEVQAYRKRPQSNCDEVCKCLVL